MFGSVLLYAFLACVAASPEYASYNSYIPLAKSTLTASSQSVDHGSTHVLHAPVLHTSNTEEIHAPVFHATEYASYNSYVPLAKSTLTASSQSVDHGSTHVLHAPVLHATELHAPVLQSSELHASPIKVSSGLFTKSTLTQSNQYVNHGSTAIAHAPVLQAPVHVQPLFASAPVAYRTADSAVSHQSSTVHETVPVPSLFSIHH